MRSKRWAAIGFVAMSLLFVMGAISISGFPEQQKRQGQLVTHAWQVSNELNTLALHVTEAETGQRGYLLTGGREEYLRPYQAATRQIDGDLQRLKALMTADVVRPGPLLQLQQDIAEKLAELKQTLDLYQSGEGKQEAMRVVLSGRAGTT